MVLKISSRPEAGQNLAAEAVPDLAAEAGQNLAAEAGQNLAAEAVPDLRSKTVGIYDSLTAGLSCAGIFFWYIIFQSEEGKTNTLEEEKIRQREE